MKNVNRYRWHTDRDDDEDRQPDRGRQRQGGKKQARTDRTKTAILEIYFNAIYFRVNLNLEFY